MLGTIASLIITALFIRRALSVKRNPITAGLIGFCAFFIPALLWTYFVTPSLKDSLLHNPNNSLLYYFAQYAYILISSITATWVWHQIFKK